MLVNPPEGSGVNPSGGFVTGSSSASETRTGMGRFYSKSKANVIEKIKTDFNTSKKEHVVHLTRLPPVPDHPGRQAGAHTIDPTIWADLLTRMKEGASAAFSSTVEAQEEEIRRCETARGKAGWDFCSYFLSKDALARTLEGIGLCDDAVAQYEDLEAVFLQALRSGSVSFAHVGGDGPNDDSMPLLDINKKPYQELIRSRSISLFDFRCYLFARRASLLGQLGRVAQVMREAPTFIGAVRRMLSVNPHISKRIIDSWAFSASLDVVEQCQAWVIQRGDAPTIENRLGSDGRPAYSLAAATSSTEIDDQLSPAFHAAKAELLDLARRQLDKMGIAVGHLPKYEPFVLSIQDDAAATGRMSRDLPPLPPEAASGRDKEENAKVSRPELQQAIESQELFDSHYVTLAERIITGWSAGGRRRNVLRLRVVLAALDFHRGRYSKAYTAFLELTEAYHESRWVTVERHLLALQLECHRRLQKSMDRAWVSVVMAAIRAAEGQPAHTAAIDTSEQSEGSQAIYQWQDQRFLFDRLRQAASTFEKELPVSGYRALTIVPLSRKAALAEGEDGSALQVAVVSSLGFELAVDDVRLCLIGRDEDILWVTSGRVTLQPGKTHLRLFCGTPASGSFCLDVSQIRLSKLIFQYPPPSSASSSRTTESQPVLVTIPKDGHAVDIQARLPREIHLDEPRQVELQLSSGRNTITSAELSVATSESKPLGPLDAAELVPDSPSMTSLPSGVELERPDGPDAERQVLRISGISPRTKAIIRLPMTATAPDGVLLLNFVVTYTTGEKPGPRSPSKRTLRKTVPLTISLPLGVNVQDFFRSANLFCKFAITSGGSGSLRLQPAKLVSSGGDQSNLPEGGLYQVLHCGSSQEVVVTPRQPASYLFKIESRGQAGDGSATPTPGKSKQSQLRLVLEYRTLLEEAQALVLASLEACSANVDISLASETPARILLERALASYVEARLDLPAYSLTGEVRTGKFDAVWWRRETATWQLPGEQGKTALQLAQTTLDTTLSAGSGPAGDWRILSIPVDVPRIDAVNAVTLTVRGGGAQPRAGYQATLVVGNPVTVSVSISTSFKWGTSDSPAVGHCFAYDVVADFENWLVSGSKRATYAPDPDTPHTFSVQLIPLKTGVLALPNVAVRPVGTEQLSCETYVTNAAERVQVVPRRWRSSFWVDTAGLDERTWEQREQETYA